MSDIFCFPPLSCQMFLYVKVLDLKCCLASVQTAEAWINNSKVRLLLHKFATCEHALHAKLKLECFSYRQNKQGWEHHAEPHLQQQIEDKELHNLLKVAKQWNEPVLWIFSPEFGNPETLSSAAALY